MLVAAAVGVAAVAVGLLLAAAGGNTSTASPVVVAAVVVRFLPFAGHEAALQACAVAVLLGPLIFQRFNSHSRLAR